MNRVCRSLSLLLLLLSVLLTACQQYQYVSGARLGLRDYPDAIVHINQVDPAYRHHFEAQHGSSFSLSDQRKAFTAAKETARTPVKESAYRPAKATPRKSSVSRRGKQARRSTTSSRGKAAKGRKASSKKTSGKQKSKKKSGKKKRRR